MTICSYMDQFRQQGFAGIDSWISLEKINKLSELVKKKYETIPQSHPDYKCSGMQCIQNLLEHVPYAGVVANDIVSHSPVRGLLEEMLGKGYKLWSVSARRAPAVDPGLFLHQDGVGEVSIFLSLDDNLKGEGASILLPSSHLIKTSMKKWKVEMPPALLNLFPFMFARLSGPKGGVSVFSHRTWHGRSRNSSSCDHDVLTMTFFPAGYNNFCGPSKFVDQQVSTYSGTELGVLLAGSSDFLGTIASNCDCRESGAIKYFDGKSYVLNIEDHEFLSKFKKPFKLIFSVMIIRFIMFFVPLARWFRKISAK